MAIRFDRNSVQAQTLKSFIFVIKASESAFGREQIRGMNAPNLSRLTIICQQQSPILVIHGAFAIIPCLGFGKFTTFSLAITSAVVQTRLSLVDVALKVVQLVALAGAHS